MTGIVRVPNGTKSLGRQEFKDILPSHPGIVHKRQTPTSCDGLVPGRFSFKRQREGTIVGCKNPAYWAFRHLADRTGCRPATSHYCWPHLMHRGVYGTMEETDRTYTWLRRRGYKTEKYWTGTED